MISTVELRPHRTWINWNGLAARIVGKYPSVERPGMITVSIDRYNSSGTYLCNAHVDVEPGAQWTTTRNPMSSL